MTLGLMMGCLKSESGKWGRAGVQRTRRHSRIDAQRHGRIYSGHPRLACCDVVKAWMPGTKPGMTDERPGTDTQRHGRIDAKLHGRIYSGHPRLACCDVVKAWMPGTRPGMTDERPGTDTQRHGRIDAQRHAGLTRSVMAGFIPAIHVLPAAMS